MTTTHPDPATHRRAMQALAATAAAHRRAMELFHQEQALRIARSALIRAASGTLTPGELREELQLLAARIEELEREAGIEYRAAEATHRRAMDAFDRSVDA